MNSLIRTVIEAAWRRRMLILTPIVVLSAISFVLAVALPRTYESTALVLLQEDGGPSALTDRGRSRIDEIRQRVDALSALVTSESLLERVIVDLGIADLDDTAQLGIEIREFRESLQVEAIGSQFVSFTLRGSSPPDLQLRLTTILTRMFEALLLPSEEASGAPDFLIRQLREELAEAEAELAAFDGAAYTAARLAALERDRNTASARLDSLAVDITAARTALRLAMAAADPAADETSQPSMRIAEIDAALVELRAAQPQDAATIAAAEATLAALRALLPQEQAIAELAAQEARARTELALALDAISSHQLNAGRLAELVVRVEGARAQVQAYVARFRSGGGQSIYILRAPEQMQIVDSPSLPSRPVNSALKILLIGVAAGVAFGCGMTVIIEQLDQSLRSADDFAGVADSPLVARIPKIPEEDVEAIKARATRFDGSSMGAGSPPAPDPEPTSGILGKVVKL